SRSRLLLADFQVCLLDLLSFFRLCDLLLLHHHLKERLREVRESVVALDDGHQPLPPPSILKPRMLVPALIRESSGELPTTVSIGAGCANPMPPSIRRRIGSMAACVCCVPSCAAARFRPKAPCPA